MYKRSEKKRGERKRERDIKKIPLKKVILLKLLYSTNKSIIWITQKGLSSNQRIIIGYKLMFSQIKSRRYLF